MTIRDELTALTADQPPQPPDRISSVTRRSRRIRRTRAAAAVAAVLAVAAPVGLLLAGPSTKSGPSFASEPVTQWPDRSAKEDRGVADGARAMFVSEGGDDSRLQWLYRGPVVTSLQGDGLHDVPSYVAVFVADRDGQRVVVAAQTQLDQVDDHGLGGQEHDGQYPWASHEVPTSAVGDHVGLYLSGQRRSTDADGVVTDDVVSTTLFALAAPSARVLQWVTHPLPAASTSYTTPEGVVTSDDGVFRSIQLVITGPATMTLADGHGHTSAVSPFGTGTSQPALFRPATPEPPAGWQRDAAATGQSEPQEDGSWTVAGYVNLNANPHRPLALLMRCYGGGRITATLSPYREGASSTEEGGGGRTGPGRVLPCDGHTHTAAPLAAVSTPGFELRLQVDRLVAYSYALGSVGGRTG